MACGCCGCLERCLAAGVLPWLVCRSTPLNKYLHILTLCVFTLCICQKGLYVEVDGWIFFSFF